MSLPDKPVSCPQTNEVCQYAVVIAQFHDESKLTRQALVDLKVEVKGMGERIEGRLVAFQEAGERRQAAIDKLNASVIEGTNAEPSLRDQVRQTTKWQEDFDEAVKQNKAEIAEDKRQKKGFLNDWGLQAAGWLVAFLVFVSNIFWGIRLENKITNNPPAAAQPADEQQPPPADRPKSTGGKVHGDNDTGVVKYANTTRG